jgi:NAD(P)-dependent dehydrogenase (short-subunit alcohol dehydrogenase family)
MKTLNDQVVIITGGAKGIGFQDAKLFLEAGAKVAICDLSKKETDIAQKKLEKYGQVFAKVVDIRQEKEVKKFINCH